MDREQLGSDMARPVRPRSGVRQSPALGRDRTGQGLGLDQGRLDGRFPESSTRSALCNCRALFLAVFQMLGPKPPHPTRGWRSLAVGRLVRLPASKTLPGDQAFRRSHRGYFAMILPPGSGCLFPTSKGSVLVCPGSGPGVRCSTQPCPSDLTVAEPIVRVELARSAFDFGHRTAATLPGRPSRPDLCNALASGPAPAALPIHLGPRYLQHTGRQGQEPSHRRMASSAWCRRLERK